MELWIPWKGRWEDRLLSSDAAIFSSFSTPVLVLLSFSRFVSKAVSSFLLSFFSLSTFTIRKMLCILRSRYV